MHILAVGKFTMEAIPLTNKQKQHLLAYLGYYDGKVDGIWGSISESAAIRFQRDYDLEPDGIVGKMTESKLREVIGSGVDSPKPKTQESLDFWNEIEHFAHGEFACPCGRCGGFPSEPKEKLVRLAESVRNHFDSVSLVSSGVRCQEHNDELSGSVPNSRHLYGKAVDFCIVGESGESVLKYVKTLPDVRYAYNIDGTYVHMDIE